MIVLMVAPAIMLSGLQASISAPTSAFRGCLHDAAAVAERFGLASVVDWSRVERLVRSGHLTSDGRQITVTSRGRLLLDHILGEIAARTPMDAAVAG